MFIEGVLLKTTDIVVIAHNIRSIHNVGSLFRLCDGLGVSQLFLTGYTPYPTSELDERLPHIARRQHAQIAKTALGAEDSVLWQHHNDVGYIVQILKNKKYCIVGLEQTTKSIPLHKYRAPEKIAIILGEERYGMDDFTRSLCSDFVEIPMLGQKESFNVITAAAMILFQCRYHS